MENYTIQSGTHHFLLTLHSSLSVRLSRTVSEINGHFHLKLDENRKFSPFPVYLIAATQGVPLGIPIA